MLVNGTLVPTEYAIRIRLSPRWESDKERAEVRAMLHENLDAILDRAPRPLLVPGSRFVVDVSVDSELSP